MISQTAQRQSPSASRVLLAASKSIQPAAAAKYKKLAPAVRELGGPIWFRKEWPSRRKPARPFRWRSSREPRRGPSINRFMASLISLGTGWRNRAGRRLKNAVHWRCPFGKAAGIWMTDVKPAD